MKKIVFDMAVWIVSESDFNRIVRASVDNDKLLLRSILDKIRESQKPVYNLDIVIDKSMWDF